MILTMDSTTVKVPSSGWQVRLDHEFPNRLSQKISAKLNQVWVILPLTLRYIWFCFKLWWNGRKPIMDLLRPLTSQQLSGVPLGGIGGGTVGRSFRGDFCRYHMVPGIYEYNVVRANQFIVTVQDTENKVVYNQVLSILSDGGNNELSSWNWDFPGSDAKYTALYPRSWTEYEIPQHNLKLTCRQVSPVIPHNYKDSCVPGGVFVWSVENTSSEVKVVSITCTLKNGTGGVQDSKGSPKSELFAMNESCVNVTGVQIHQQINDIHFTYSLGALVKEGVSVSRIAAFDPNGDGSQVWNNLATEGHLTDDDGTNFVGSELACAVCATVKVAGVDSTTVEFSLVWDMPQIHFGAKKKQYYRYYTKYFGKDGKAGPVMCHYALTNFPRWEQDIFQWQKPILEDLNLPEWYKSAIFNELYYIADGGTVWLSTNESETTCKSDPRNEFGRFAYLEGHEYRMYNTYDVHFYASFALAQLWPKLQACIQYDFRDAALATDHELRPYLFDGKVNVRNEKNCIPHDLGDPSEEPFVLVNAYNVHDVSEWKDLNLKFVLQCCRDYALTNDIQYLKDMWPTMQVVMSKALEWDTDNDGVIENSSIPDQTYDTWVMTGTSAYCGGMWLACLQCMAHTAAILNNSEEEQKYLNLLQKATPAFHKKLWNGQYYNFDCSAGAHSSSVMSDQLCGLWYLNSCLIPQQIFPKENVQSALETIYRLNVQGFEGGKMGAVNGMLPDGTVDVFTIQSEEVWTGVTYGLASLMIFEGLVKEGFNTASGIYDTVFNRIGLGFETPEALHPVNNYRSIGYMRPLSIWSMQLAWEQHKQHQSGTS